jgi:hypothetical protein
MKLVSFLLIGFTVLFSCSDKENSQQPLAGDYVGTFYRTRDNVKVLESAITLVFNNGEFSGGGANHQSPAVCRGTYSLGVNEVDFANQCFFTANFDWTLILSGKFTISETSEAIILSKEIDSQNGDFYELSKSVDLQ